MVVSVDYRSHAVRRTEALCFGGFGASGRSSLDGDGTRGVGQPNDESGLDEDWLPGLGLSTGGAAKSRPRATFCDESETISLDIQVLDSGCGIPAGKIDLLFRPFSQPVAAVTGGSAGGTGLGLTIVKFIVERMGGAGPTPPNGPAVAEARCGWSVWFHDCTSKTRVSPPKLSRRQRESDQRGGSRLVLQHLHPLASHAASGRERLWARSAAAVPASTADRRGGDSSEQPEGCGAGDSLCGGNEGFQRVA